MKTVNKLDYIYKKLLYKANSQKNDIINISDDEYDEIYCHDYSKDYLTFVSLEDNNIIEWKTYKYNSDYYLTKTISISIDNGITWIEKESSVKGTTLAILNNGNKLLIKGLNDYYGRNGINPKWYNYFTSTNNFNIEGNIMSLIYGDNFINKNEFPNSCNNFYYLFNRCTKLISTKNLILPATILTGNCYENMFFYCISLIDTPKLPAMTLAMECYREMFHDCISLTIAPELPAMTLKDFCYNGMFMGCTSLIKAPELPATILTFGCYHYMFNGCYSLLKAPELLAITLVKSCYKAMFAGCTSLNYIKCLATNYNINNAYPQTTKYFTLGVSSPGIFIKHQNANNWETGENGIPQGWTVQELDPDTGEIVNEYIV